MEGSEEGEGEGGSSSPSLGCVLSRLCVWKSCVIVVFTFILEAMGEGRRKKWLTDVQKRKSIEEYEESLQQVQKKTEMNRSRWEGQADFSRPFSSSSSVLERRISDAFFS